MKVKKNSFNRTFPLFQSHLDLAHDLWTKVLASGGWAIDATCGNGHDTLFLSKHIQDGCGLIGLDLQIGAIQSTQTRLEQNEAPMESIHLFCQSHAEFPSIAFEHPIQLIVYNLGYLPGGDKSLTTLKSSTEASVLQGLNLLAPGGVMSLTCYPGHPEGLKEEEALLELARGLSPETWSVTFHQWKNRTSSPSLLLIQKNTL